MEKRNKNNYQAPQRTSIMGPDGKMVDLSSLPLVAFALSCGHLGRDYAVQKRDLIFCETCGTTKRVNRIIAE